MTGGLIQLVAYGPQDIFLISDPQITFFKIVYRRHTNFSTEVIPQFFTHTPDFGKRVTCILSRNGDLIRGMHLVAVLPKIPKFKDEHGNEDLITKFAWVKRIGFALIKRIEIEIGGELIDRQYGDWLNIWYELTVPPNKDLSVILGDVKELTEFTNGKKSYKLFIPLQFWFNRVTGLALPVISLQYNHVKLNLEINDFDKLSIICPTNYIELETDLAPFKEGELLKQTIHGVTSWARFCHYDIVTKRLYYLRITDNKFQGPKPSKQDDCCDKLQRSGQLKVKPKYGEHLDHSMFETEEARREFVFERDSDNNLVHSKFLIIGLCSKCEVMPKLKAKERKYKACNRKKLDKKFCLKDAFLLVEYIYLDTEERNRFYRARHEYLIEQLLYNGERTIDGINKSFRIGFTHPCKELFWVAQLSLFQNCRLNQHFNYTNCLKLNCEDDDEEEAQALEDDIVQPDNLNIAVGFPHNKIFDTSNHVPINYDNGNPTQGKCNIIKKETILFNSLETLSFMASEYFTLIQPYQHHRSAPSEFGKGIHVYSFALHPEKHQPSGSANMTRIDNVWLKLNVIPTINCDNTAKLRIYGLVYNILRIASGISGLVFANDIYNY